MIFEIFFLLILGKVYENKISDLPLRQFCVETKLLNLACNVYSVPPENRVVIPACLIVFIDELGPRFPVWLVCQLARVDLIHKNFRLV